MDSTLVDRTSLGDIQGVTGLVELNAAFIGEAEVRQDSVGIVNTDFLTLHFNDRCCTAGTARKARDLQSGLHIGNQVIIVRRKVRNCFRTCVIEDIAFGTRLICRIQNKRICVTKTAYDLEDQELGGHSQRHVGVIRLRRGSNTDGMIPQFVCIEKNQANGFTAVGIQRIPDAAAFCTATSVEGNITINRVARCTGCKISMGFNTVKRLICISHIAVSCKVPAEILQVTVQ